MIPAALKRAIAQQHSALNEFVKGNIAPWNQICSQADDATIIGGWGGFEKGWSAQVEKRYAWAASRFKGADGHVQVENISLIATPELAYSVDIERSRVRLAGTEQFARDPARAGTDGRRAR